MNFRKLVLIAVAAISLVSCKEDNDIILFSKPNLIFPVAGGEELIGLDCKDEWNIILPEECWIESITPMSGKGNTTLKVKVPANPLGKRRTTSVYINNQSLLVMQEFKDVNITELYGVWETADKDFKFTFNEDKTCKSEMTKGGTYDGKYTLSGNIITISINDSPKKIVVLIEEEIKDNTLIASMGGQKLTLKKVID